MRREHELNFGNLSFGDHEFKYKLESDFFSDWGNPAVEDGEVDVLLFLSKSETQLDLKFQLKGFVKCICDICLSPLDYPINASNELLVKFGEAKLEGIDDLIYVGHDEYKLDLAQHMYDYCVLHLPIKKVCEESINRTSCDEEILNKMHDQDSEDESENVHPEWQKLKDIFKN